MYKVFQNTKYFQRWDITKRKDNRRKVYVRQFFGFKVDCMKDYMKFCFRNNDLDYLIIQTMYVPSASLAKEMKASKLDGSISNRKLMEVNSCLKDLCESNDIFFISNITTNPKKHLNKSWLHLNPKGSNKLFDNFVRYLKGFTSWESAKQNWLQCALDQKLTLTLQVEPPKLLIRNNLIMSIWVFLEKHNQIVLSGTLISTPFEIDSIISLLLTKEMLTY